MNQLEILRKVGLYDKFKDKTIVFTGFRDKELEQQIIKQGGKIGKSISKNTSILICHGYNIANQANEENLIETESMKPEIEPGGPPELKKQRRVLRTMIEERSSMLRMKDLDPYQRTP